MIFKQVKGYLVLQVFLLLLTMGVTMWGLLSGHLLLVAIIVPVIIYQVIVLVKFQLKIFEELKQFVESVRYRDFSGNFSAKNAPAEFRELRSGFNEINALLKTISREKEAQYHYLQKVLELVDTGILFYNEANGDVLWMNGSLKKMLRLPYLKKIGSLKARNGELYLEILNVRPAQPQLVTLADDEGPVKVILSASHFTTDGTGYRLIAFQNVNEVLDETETKAWQKLLGVLTHEIMNSIAPISSLADTLTLRVQELNQSHNDLNDIKIGIDTIKRRSEGLLKFAGTYRNLNKISSPAIQKVIVRQLFETIYQLMLPMLKQKEIELEIVLKDTDLSLAADPALLEQVVINLVINAVEAVKDRENRRIVLSAYASGTNKTTLKIADNGPGIPDDLLDRIFIPFFSTKKNGSGIGLSLCKQILLMHRATIRVHSKLGEGTAFLLQF